MLNNKLKTPVSHFVQRYMNLYCKLALMMVKQHHFGVSDNEAIQTESLTNSLLYLST